MRTSVIACLFLIMYFLSASAHSQAEMQSTPTPNASNVLAVGYGAETGILGFKYMKQRDNSSLIWAIGIGLEGIVPQIQYPLRNIGSFNIYASGLVWYNPWGFLLTSPGSVVLGGSIGIQKWVYKKKEFGLYLNFGVSTLFQVRGESEGGGEDDFLGISPNIQIGFSF